MQREAIYYLFDQVYAGSRKSIFAGVMDPCEITNEHVADVCRYACEYYLHWAPEDTVRNLNIAVLKTLGLHQMVLSRLKLPDDISGAERYEYLLELMYPDLMGPVTKEERAIRVYLKAVRDRESSIPHSFFSGSWAAEQNARICLLYALAKYARCHTKAECYRFVEYGKTNRFFQDMRLEHIIKRKYKGNAKAFLDEAFLYIGDVDAKFGIAD